MKHNFKKLFKHLRDLDKGLLILCTLMFGLGLLNIVTASSSEAVVRYDVSLFYYFFKQLQILLIGTVAFVIITKIDTKRYKPFAIIGYIIIFIIALYLLFNGVFLKGAKNWISILGISFQPSEFAKPVIILCLALIFDLFHNKLNSKDNDRYTLYALIAFVGLAIPVIVVLQKDLGTASIIVAIFAVMLAASPIGFKDKRAIFVTGFVIAFIGVTILIFNGSKILPLEYQSRLNYFDPCSKYETGGYQTCNGYIAINEGGIFGLGLGKSKQKYSYIPEPHTDSVFAIIAEENGLIGGTIVFGLYYLILRRIIRIAQFANTTRGKYIALGVATYIFVHIFINMGGLFAIIPLTGVPLPFLSYGGSYALSLVVALAMVQRVHIETKNQKLKI